MKCLILSKRSWSFVTEKDGEVLEGETVEYVDPDCTFEGETERAGIPVFKMSVSKKLGATIMKLPGVYSVDMRKRPGKGGKAVETAVSVKFEKTVDLAKLTENGTSR